MGIRVAHSQKIGPVSLISQFIFCSNISLSEASISNCRHEDLEARRIDYLPVPQFHYLIPTNKIKYYMDHDSHARSWEDHLAFPNLSFISNSKNILGQPSLATTLFRSSNGKCHLKYYFESERKFEVYNRIFDEIVPVILTAYYEPFLAYDKGSFYYEALFTYVALILVSFAMKCAYISVLCY